jgi:hypothetical protein
MNVVAKSLNCFFVTPANDTTFLLNITKWDHEHQGSYQFQKAVTLPAGSTIYCSTTYDNSTQNPKNPNNPPDTVYKGVGINDEWLAIYFNYLSFQLSDTNLLIDTSSHIFHDQSCVTLSSLNQSENYFMPTVYPNPTTGKLFIDELDGVYRVNLTDLSGQTIWENMVTGNSFLDLSNYNNGLYMLTIENEEYYKHIKIIKQ